jgi:hypothetical protein
MNAREEQGEKQKLYVCLDRGTGEIFYASMITRSLTQAHLRSSRYVEKGASLLILPVPTDWNGEAYSAQAIREDRNAIEAHVNRVEGRGSFFVRLISSMEQEILNRVRTGQMQEDNLKIARSQAGLITTVKLSGGLGIDSAARVQVELREIGAEMPLVLLDLTGLAYFAKGGLGWFYLVLKEAMERGLVIRILAKKGSRIEEFLQDSKINRLVRVFYQRDQAVGDLLQSMMQDVE